MTPTTPEFGPGGWVGGPDSLEVPTGASLVAGGPERPLLDVAEGRRLLGEYRAAVHGLADEDGVERLALAERDAWFWAFNNVEALLDAAEERDLLRAEMHARELHHFETEQENAALHAALDGQEG